MFFDEEKNIIKHLKSKALAPENQGNPITDDLLKLITVTESIMQDSEKMAVFSDALEKSLKESNDKLILANEVKGQLINLALHDLGNPLTIISSYSKLLRVRMPQTPESVKMLEKIEKATERMKHLRMELLGNERFELSSVKLLSENFLLGDIVKLVISDNQLQLQNKQQRLIYAPRREHACLVKADRILVNEIVENLLSNAIKYSPPGAELRLSLECLPGENRKERVRLGVHDQGPGFTKRDIACMFKEMHPLSARPTAGERSSGIGLFLAKKFADLLEGDLWLESTRETGSLFCFELDRAQ